MHSRDPQKDTDEFTREIQVIISRNREHDFTRFVFLEVDFRRASFLGDAYFLESSFMQRADFSEVKFFGHAGFWKATFWEDADFWGASFGPPPQSPEAAPHMLPKVADFRETTFGHNANFAGAIFRHTADFSQAVFGPRLGQFAGSDASQEDVAIADFRAVRFEKPEEARFYRVNRHSSQGLLLRIVDCEVQGIPFEDVNWHRERGRMVLQDELDIIVGSTNSLSAVAESVTEVRHELVAIAYRRLVSNFERVRAYDLAEDCFIGTMEMKRLDPRQPLHNRTVLNLYRLASYYGSSYGRAILVLLAFVFLGFSTAFALPWAGLEPQQGLVNTAHTSPYIHAMKHWSRGIYHSVEVATFQHDTRYITRTVLGSVVAMLENIFVPAQLALLLLALRRRFRR